MIPTSGEPFGVLCQLEALGFLDRAVEVQRAIIPRILGVPIIVGIVHSIIGGLTFSLEARELAAIDRLHDVLRDYHSDFLSGWLSIFEGELVGRRAMEGGALAPLRVRNTPQAKLRDVHAWIETLHELSIEAGEAIEDPLAREGLARFLKAGKARKPARALPDLASAQSEAHRSAAAAHAIHRRLTRAERWVTLTKQATKTRKHLRP
jgi:hypothetical protein